LSGLSA